MKGAEKITSIQNPKIKLLKKLEKASERREQNLFVIEGLRETVLAHRAGYEIVSVFVNEEILKQDGDYDFSELEQEKLKPDFFHISKEVYDSLAYRETTEGIIATARPQAHGLDELKLSDTPLILIIEAVEKPGNLGAMLRTCDAAAVDAVFICDAKTDIYNSNVIRSSVGTVFTNPIVICDSQQAIDFLKSKGITIFAAELSTSKFYYQQNFKKASAIVVGTEAHGLSQTWINSADEKIKIPMLGQIDSLNVSVSAAVLLFEAVRQRSV
ncbi:MAG: hypothetical protein JWO06_412 [Bacteroidota bacterium]|nr:hypothetical protein [Bacteroidota bacterium]